MHRKQGWLAYAWGMSMWGNDSVMRAALRLAVACDALSQHGHADVLALEVFYRFVSQSVGSRLIGFLAQRLLV
jgi:hypothetical protein